MLKENPESLSFRAFTAARPSWEHAPHSQETLLWHKWMGRGHTDQLLGYKSNAFRLERISEGPLVQLPPPNVNALDQVEAFKLPIHLLPRTSSADALFRSLLRIKKQCSASHHNDFRAQLLLYGHFYYANTDLSNHNSPKNKHIHEKTHQMTVHRNITG